MILILGVVILVRVINGKITKNMKIKMLSTNQDYIVEKVGVFTPKAKDINELNTGELGFIQLELKFYLKQKLVIQFVMLQSKSRSFTWI
jgi:GTP-binding protein LepA